MKYIHYIAAIISLGFLTSRAEAKMGSFVVNMTATQQSLVEANSSRTNVTATSTNVTTVIQSTTTNTVINNAKLLKMLANSFNTNLPANAALKIDTGLSGIVVAVGTNVLLNASSVLTLNFSGDVITEAGIGTQTQKHTRTVDTASNRANLLLTSIGSFTYDDSTLSTADGTTTKFSIAGFTTTRFNLALSTVGTNSTSAISIAATVTGAGVGSISGKNAIVRGFVVESGSLTSP